MTTNQRYPLATADGQAIPLEVINPKGVLRANFVETAGTGLLTLPSCELVSVFTTAECFIAFNEIAAVPTDGVFKANLIHLPRSVGIVFSPPSLNISIIGVSMSGVATIQVHEQWAGLALKQQYQHR